MIRLEMGVVCWLEVPSRCLGWWVVFAGHACAKACRFGPPDYLKGEARFEYIVYRVSKNDYIYLIVSRPCCNVLIVA